MVFNIIYGKTMDYAMKAEIWAIVLPAGLLMNWSSVCANKSLLNTIEINKQLNKYCIFVCVCMCKHDNCLTTISF